MKALRIAGAAAAGLVVVALALLLTVGVPSGVVTSMVQDRVARDTGYRLSIDGTTDIGLWPSLNVTLHNVALDDPQNPNDGIHLTIGKLRGSFPLRGLLSGHPILSDVTIDHPLLRLPMSRKRNTPSKGPSGSAGADSNSTVALPVMRVSVSNGTVVFFDAVNRVENRIGDIDAQAAFTAGRQATIAGRARPGGHSLKFALTATVPENLSVRQNIPVALKVDTPDLLSRQLSARADVRLNGTTLLINGLSGLIGGGQFNGWASVDFAGKPLVKVDLDIQKLDIAAPSSPAASPRSAPRPWSDAPIDLTGLNYVDAQLRLSADQFTFGKAQFAPAAIDATVTGGHVKASLLQLGVYDGQISGNVAIDVSTATPAYTLQGDVTGVRALPLLSGLFDFDNLDGKMQAKLALQSRGGSLRAIMTNLDGAASADVRDGAIRNLNVAKMIRSLTSATLTGWQEQPDQTTDLTQLSASFRIAQGKAATDDLVLIGPLVRMTGAGTVDLGAKSLGFRVEPKLVMTTQGQGGTADAVGLGIPVIIEGAWNDPRIYPDIGGILDNPDAAYAKLREMGQGLFGASGGAVTGQQGTLGETLDTLIQQGLGGGATTNSPSPDGKPAPSRPSALNGLMKQLFGR